MIRAAIFDLDGTLVDSNEFHVLAWQETFRHFGKEIPLERLREQVGKGGDQYLPVFLNQIEMREFGAEADKYHGEVFKKKYLSQVKPFPKVRELFERLREDGKKIALASSGKDSEVRHYEKLLGIAGLIDGMTTSDQVVHSKPYADVFIAALNELGVPASEAVAIGDTPYDVEAAKKIELRVIGVLCGGFSEDLLRDEGAVAIYREPADLLEHYYQSPLAGSLAPSVAASLWGAHGITSERSFHSRVPQGRGYKATSAALRVAAAGSSGARRVIPAWMRSARSC